MNNALNFIKNNKYNLFLTITWLIITITTMLHHELWRDEAQVWCLVRDADFVTLIKEIQIEGHPYLWYLLNLPFAKLGCPVISMQIIGLIFVFLAVLLVLFKSPFNKFLKFLIVFNSGMLYFLPIVVRNYALIPFFMFAIADIYPKRHDKPLLYLFLLFCLSQTHSLMLCFVWVLLLFFTFEYAKLTKKNNLVIFLFFLSYVNMLFLTIMPILNIQRNIAVIGFLKSLSHLPLFPSVQYTIIGSLYTCYLPSILDENIWEYSPIVFLFIFAVIIFSLFKNDKKIGFIFLFSFIYIVAILYFIWGAGVSLQKLFLILLCNIFCLWILQNKKYFIYKKNLKILLALLLSLYLSYSTWFIKNEYSSNFSASKETAYYIKNNLSSENVILFDINANLCSSLSAYLPNVKIYSVAEKNMFHFGGLILTKKH